MATTVSEPTSMSSRALGKRKHEDSKESHLQEKCGSTSTPIPNPENTNTRHRKRLHIEIPSLLNSGQHPPAGDDDSHGSFTDSFSSLFSETSGFDSLFDEPCTGSQSTTSTIASSSGGYARTSTPTSLAIRTAPPIPGLFFSPSLQLPKVIMDKMKSYCFETYFQTPGANQVMLFGRFDQSESHSSAHSRSITGLPLPLVELLSILSNLLLPILPRETYRLLFPEAPTQARQAIINLYQPGEGISSHVDLLGRFGDGIIGVSFGSGCVMRFDKVSPDETRDEGDGKSHELNQEKPKRWDLYLPEGSVIVLSEEARYLWTHGIEKNMEDYVTRTVNHGPDTAGEPDLSESPGEWIKRGVRLSITFRWLLPGADIVGGDSSGSLPKTN